MPSDEGSATIEYAGCSTPGTSAALPPKSSHAGPGYRLQDGSEPDQSFCYNSQEEHSLRSKRTRVPPPHPDRRQEPLPEQQPKATQDDPHALQAIRAILDSPSYRLAERDVDFLARDDVRGPQLQLEYLKPDTVLREQGVEQTIVVFGSPRPRHGRPGHSLTAGAKEPQGGLACVQAFSLQRC
jgi:hypothetical protein